MDFLLHVLYTISMSKSTEDKIKRIQQLLKDKEAIDAELDSLLNPEKEVVLPVGFSLNAEVIQIVDGAGATGIDSKKILTILKQKYPKYGIERTKVASALAYLKNNKKQIDLIGRGVYKSISLENKPA